MKQLTQLLAIILLFFVAACQSDRVRMQAGTMQQAKAEGTPEPAPQGDWLLRLLARPPKTLSEGEKKWVDFIRSCKVSSREDAITRVLRLADDKSSYMADARMLLGVVAIEKVGRSIGTFAKAEDLTWVVRANMPKGVVQEFWVNARTGDAIALLPESAPNQPDRTLLSEKARGFVTSVRDDGSSFLLYLERGGYRPLRRITFFTGKRPDESLQPVEISRSEAIRIVDYFAGKGLLDKNDGLPCGIIVGWYLSLYMDRDNHVTRFVGIGKHALLGRSDVLGVRDALGTETVKKWDAFVDQVRAEITEKKKVEANPE